MIEFETNETIGVSFENGEFDNKESWLSDFYEKSFISKKIYDFFMKNIEKVKISGGFNGFSKMMFSGMEVTMYRASIRYNDLEVVELDEDETVLETKTTVIWNKDFIEEYKLLE